MRRRTPRNGIFCCLIYLPENRKIGVVGPPGIEPGLYAPEAHVLPVYDGPHDQQH